MVELSITLSIKMVVVLTLLFFKANFLIKQALYSLLRVYLPDMLSSTSMTQMWLWIIACNILPMPNLIILPWPLFKTCFIAFILVSSSINKHMS